MEFDRKLKASLVIGCDEYSWLSFLESEGVSFTIFNSDIDISRFSILIIPEKISSTSNSIVESFLSLGGTVIVEQGMKITTARENCRDVSYLYHLSTFSRLSSNSESDAIKVTFREIDSGTLIQLPFSLRDLWNDRRVEKKFIDIGNDEEPSVWETLSFVARRNVRKVLIDVLWRACHAAGLPLVQKWYWPRGTQSFFCLRADMDAGNEDSMKRYLKAVRPWAPNLSLFACGSAYSGKEKLLQDVADLGAEIGNHTYTHYIYSSETYNRKNLELTEKLLGRVGCAPKGFVGPASFWHPSMYKVLQEKGYEYTSSFGVDHDHYPYFPPRPEGGTHKMLEIPFHCLGDRFPKFGMELESTTVMRFFDQLIEKKYQASEPINIYGHPDMPDRMGDSPKLVEGICRKALSLDNISTGNMSDLASWWEKRHAAQATIEYDMSSNRLVAKNMQSDPDVFWSIKVEEKGQYLISGEDLCKGISLDSLEHFPQMNLQSSAGILTGEVIDPPFPKGGLMQYIKDGRRSFRRKSRKIKELKSACNKEDWRKDD